MIYWRYETKGYGILLEASDITEQYLYVLREKRTSTEGRR